MTDNWSYILLLPPAVVLAAEDFRARRVSVVWLALLATAALAAEGLAAGFRQTLFHAAVNTGLSAVTGGVVCGYLRLRRIPLHTSFGAGDAVILLAITPLFTPVGYIRFLIAVCIAALAGAYIAGWKTVPYAGVLAVLLGGYAICKLAGVWN